MAETYVYPELWAYGTSLQLRLHYPDELREAIHQLISSHDAEYDRQNRWGRHYNVIGPLYGPDGIVGVVTVWIQKEPDGDFSFVTLVPSK